MSKHSEQIGRLTRIICALALILIGFAHKPPAIFPSIPVGEFAAYVLPDGTVPLLCDPSSPDDEDHGRFHDHGRCEACMLSASTLLPLPPTLAVPPRRLAETLLLPGLETGPAAVFRLTAAPRGPPPSFLA